MESRSQGRLRVALGCAADACQSSEKVSMPCVQQTD